jgi:uncharacterized protein (TIGR02594 family)
MVDFPVESSANTSKLKVSACDIAERFVGVDEVPGSTANPQILSMLRLDADWPEDDSVPWCSGFVNYVAWLLRLPRSKSLLARSWLNIGTPIATKEAKKGFDVVILRRGTGHQPGPENTTAPGHVGFYMSQDHIRIWLLGGNQGNTVSVKAYDKDRVLGVRRLI